MIILGVRNFRVFEILEHLPYSLLFLGLYDFDIGSKKVYNYMYVKFVIVLSA